MALTNVKDYDNDVKMQIGQRIQQARLEKGMPAVDLAAYLNIDKNQMSRIENGRANCTIDKLYVIAQVLECSADFLLSGKKVKPMTPELQMAMRNLVKAYSAQ